MIKNPKISIAIPTSEMGGKGGDFLNRSLQFILIQTFKDFEIIITDNSDDDRIESVYKSWIPFGLDMKYSRNPVKGMAQNTNEAIRKSSGEIIKILYLDDYLAHQNSLNDIVTNWKGGWLVTGCIHNENGKVFANHYPTFSTGDDDNMIGSPSVLAMENKDPLLFDENMTWLLDFDIYKRLYERYGAPTILNDINVVIGLGEHQMTHIISNELKLKEGEYLIKKYEN